ncbi:hypothetical protein OEA41_008357 [Lepraria neglecta]|uniref:DUF3824 domain-containing protein n=1 Tax=Lepraria neglecta TaxID=209136 RepID=A0AAD9ZEB1_9LECA|nr:hypothetical protein OEA41_008357 [Lepraria neglecta]
MDPLSATASIVGIVAFGIQIAQILQREIDTIQTATERVEQIVIEIRATSTGLTNLQDFLIQDIEASLDEQIFNDEGRNEVAHIVRRCNTVFRNITVLVAKAGNGILSSVDQYQRQVEEEHKKKKGIEDSNVQLEIELSNLEHLMWPWRLPKIEQYIADLDRLKLSLVLILSVANLAKTKKTKKKKIKDNDAESEIWEGSQAETLVQDEIFYQDRGLQEAEKKYKTLTVGPSPADGITQRTHVAAEILISNWPDSPSGRGISSITELHESGVILEGFAFNPDELNQTIIEMPLNMNSMQQHALRRRRWGSKKPSSVWDSFAGLPNYQQEMILEFIAKRKRDLYDYNYSNSPASPQLVLISLNIAKHRWQRLLEALKRFVNIDPSDAPRRSTFFIVIARVTESRRNGPEPLISTTTPWRPLSDGGDPYGSDRDYSSDSDYRSRSRSRIRYNSRTRSHTRRRYEPSRSRSRTRGRKRALLSLFVHGVKAGYQKENSKRIAEERRSRTRSRRNRYSSYSDYPESASQIGATTANGVAAHDYYSATSNFPPPPDTTEPPQARDQVYDVAQVRRVTTLNEDGVYELSSALPPPNVGRRPTVKEGDSTEPAVDLPPPPRRKTTFREDADHGGRSVAGRALTALGIRTATGGQRKSSPPAENNLASSTMARSSRDVRLTRGERSRHDRSRSRSRSRQIVPRRRTRRSSSSSSDGGRGARRSKRGEPSTQMYRKSPERPIIRTFADDGIPPTQRDKAAVAEYYLKKWTTAYDNVRARNRERRYTTRATGRSRSRSRSGYKSQPPRGYDPGLIEYGDMPTYGKLDGTTAYYDPYPPPPPGQTRYYDPYAPPLGQGEPSYYPPPPGQGGYYDGNPYQGTYNPADYPPLPGAAAAGASAYEARKQKKIEERERERRDRSSTSESDDGRKRRHRRQEENSGAADEGIQTYRPPRAVGVVHTDDEEEEENNPVGSPAALAVPSSQRAYAESVPDNANGGEEVVEEAKRY